MAKTFARQVMEWNEMGWYGMALEAGEFLVGLVVSVGLEVFVLERGKRHKHTLKMWKSAWRERGRVEEKERGRLGIG